MPKRPRFSRWRRLPKVFRSGEHHLPDPNQEPQRLTLYLPGHYLDHAQLQAQKQGIASIQEYCEGLLKDVFENQRLQEHVAALEARQGALTGLHEIANDPEYLAEWSAQVHPFRRPVEVAEPLRLLAAEPTEPAMTDEARDDYAAFSDAARVVLRHAGLAADDSMMFLPTLRRGESVPVGSAAELARALQALEAELRQTANLERTLAFALHRLAYEAQVLLTDAWPGAFDTWTIEMIRATQEAVERILLGPASRDVSPATQPESLP